MFISISGKEEFFTPAENTKPFKKQALLQIPITLRYYILYDFFRNVYYRDRNLLYNNRFDIQIFTDLLDNSCMMANT